MSIFNENIEPNLWGPSAWKFIHYTALAYPMEPTDKQKKEYFTFFHNLQNTLPCKKCSQNYMLNLQEIPLENALDNNDSLFKWTIDMHNEVNKELGKKIYSYEEIYREFYNHQNNSQYETIMFLALLLLAFFIILFIQKKTNLFSRLF